jgi:FtsP/CotA-like multicopper oxidase with cupredoxin domain
MKRRHFLQLAGSTLVCRCFALTSGRTRYWLRVAPGFVIDNSRAGEPIRVRESERVFFHFLNAGVTEDVLLHLPGHRFTVIALDGNPVPTPAAVDVVGLAAGERIEAMVEMNNPGHWLLGSVDDPLRNGGMSIPVEYSNRTGTAQWQAPAAIDWSYVRFSAARGANHQPDELIEMLWEAPGQWIVNGRPCVEVESMALQPGRRYKLRMLNATSKPHLLHLRHHRFELTRVNQIPVSGIIKDTVRLERYNVIEADVL